MAEMDVPVDLYIAAYDDPDAAQADWDAIKALARDDVIKVDGLVLVSRDAADGKIHVKDNAHDVGKGAAIGAVGGALIGLIFPPAIFASAVVGAGLGGGAGAVLDHEQKKELKADGEDVLPPGSSGIVVITFFIVAPSTAIAKAEMVTQLRLDGGSFGKVKEGAASSDAG